VAHAKLNLQRMLDWIERSLDHDMPMPTDAAIMAEFGFESAESARTLLAELADAGRITIKGYGATRTITRGRTKSLLAAAGRPEPAVIKSDPDLDAGVAKIAAILARNAPARAAAAAGQLLKAASTKPKPAPVAPKLVKEAPTMPKPEPLPSRRAITIPAEGALLAAIEHIAKDRDLPLGRAALDWAEAGMSAISVDAAPAAAASAVPMSMDELLTAVRARFAEAKAVPDRSDEIAALTERAEAAERRLDAMRAALA